MNDWPLIDTHGFTDSPYELRGIEPGRSFLPGDDCTHRRIIEIVTDHAQWKRSTFINESGFLWCYSCDVGWYPFKSGRFYGNCWSCGEVCGSLKGDVVRKKLAA